MKYTFLEKRNNGSDNKDTKREAQTKSKAFWFHKKNESKQLNEKYASDKYVTEIKEIIEEFGNIWRTKEFKNKVTNEGVYIYKYIINTMQQTIPIYIVVYDKNRTELVNKKLDELNLHRLEILEDGKNHTHGYTSSDTDGKTEYIVSYIPIGIKEGRIYFEKGYDRNSVYNTITHELIHALDFEKIPRTKMNYFPSYDADEEKSFNQYFDKYNGDIVRAIIIILYKYWSPTEFNAFQTNFFNRLISNEVILKSKGFEDHEIIKGNMEYIEECDNKKVWTWLRDIFKNRTAIKNEKLIEKVEKMSLEKFKKYFISRTKDLIEKHLKKSLRNASNSELLLKDIENSKKAFIEQINDIIINENSKHIKYKPLRIILNGKFYLNKESRYQEYKVIIRTNENVDSLEDIYDDIYSDSNIGIKDCVILFKKNIREYEKFANLSFYGKQKDVISDIVKLLSIIVTEKSDDKKDVLNLLNKKVEQLSNYIFGNLIRS